jgi:hypothetical protein
VTIFLSNASFTKRSVSSRIACFVISRLFASNTEGPYLRSQTLAMTFAAAALAN